MSTRTRDWSDTTPIDHSQNKLWPQYVREVRQDLEDRLNDILYGFIAGESFNGIKKGRLITIGTGAPSAPPGTGAAISVDIYARANGTGVPIELYAMDASGNEIQLSKGGKIPLDVSGRLANNAYLIARNYAGDGNVNILKANTGNGLELASHILAPNTAPTLANHLAPKGYIDAKLPINLAAPGTGVTGVLGVANGGTGKTLIQYGTYGALADNTPVTVTLAANFANTNYYVFCQHTGTGYGQSHTVSKDVGSFVLQVNDSSGTVAGGDYMAIGTA